MTGTPEPWQLEIPFETLVQGTIGSVVDEFGFSPSVKQPNLVRFENDRVYLDVSHDPRDGEVAIDFGRVGTDERYSLLLYFRFVAPEHEASSVDGVSWTEEEVQRTLELFASALRAHGVPILKGDPYVFERMKSLHWWDVTQPRGTSRPPHI